MKIAETSAGLFQLLTVAPQMYMCNVILECARFHSASQDRYMCNVILYSIRCVSAAIITIDFSILNLNANNNSSKGN
jgi:hypothetical protein